MQKKHLNNKVDLVSPFLVMIFGPLILRARTGVADIPGRRRVFLRVGPRLPDTRQDLDDHGPDYGEVGAERD